MRLCCFQDYKSLASGNRSLQRRSSNVPEQERPTYFIHQFSAAKSKTKFFFKVNIGLVKPCDEASTHNLLLILLSQWRTSLGKLNKHLRRLDAEQVRRCEPRARRIA